MLAFLVELVILIAVLVVVHSEQRPWFFLLGVAVIITPVWILLGGNSNLCGRLCHSQAASIRRKDVTCCCRPLTGN